ncbi:hypothetical protein I3842_05G044200 [Carya illinoinensis]|uniref:Uncharacterized protein n=1 Tax=Carya illinoinensis TaxID=32201 RepID=A0A922EVX2_CARIL|nr:hypothetical protein I3842_05G044200 [Carya illinoinensis]
MKEVLMEVIQSVDNQVGSVGVEQRKPREVTERGRKTYKEALTPAGGGEGTGRGKTDNEAHRAPHVLSQERQYGRDVYDKLREMQEQLVNLQREIVKVAICVGAYKENDRTVRFGGGNGKFKGLSKSSYCGLGHQARGASNGFNNTQYGLGPSKPRPQVTRKEWRARSGTEPGPSQTQVLPARHLRVVDTPESSSGRLQKTPEKVVVASESGLVAQERPIELVEILPPPPCVNPPPGNGQKTPTECRGGDNGPARLSEMHSEVTLVGNSGDDTVMFSEIHGMGELVSISEQNPFLGADEAGSDDLFLSDEENQIGEVGFVVGDENSEEQMEFRIQNPIPLNCLFPDQSNASDWVFNTVKDIQEIVGLKCEGYEEQFMALLTAIEAGHQQHKKLDSKKQRELKRLTWSMNSESSNSRDRSKGKGVVYSK